MTNQISYHKASQEDTKTLVDYRIIFALELSGEQPKESVAALRDQMTKYFHKATSDNSCISYFAKIDNNIAGIGSIHIREMPGNFKNPSGKWAYVMNMYTVPEFRRMGGCAGILNALLDEGKKMGITAFELHATKKGERVYVKNGFEPHPEPSFRKFIENY
ncbi:MAG TPA: GNAT family N-acetyltransferase [Saprospiraceae bacterium]|nr:GNAT family N-acetyltransferase [Saprospiraceae bacterium]